MASFDLKVNVVGARFLEQLSEEDERILYGRMTGPPPKAPTYEEVSVTSDYEIEEEPFDFDAIQEQYTVIMTQSEEFLRVIKERARNLVMTIDPGSQPDLFRVVNEMYDSAELVTEITYPMYLAALRYIKDVGSVIAEEM